MKHVKTGIALDPDVARELEEVVKSLGYGSRSKAVSDAVRMFVAAHKWRAAKGRVAGVILVVYDHERHGVEDRLTDVQHEHADLIASALHVHLSDRLCMQVIAVRGDAGDVRELYRGLASVKGVLHVQPAVFHVSEEQRERSGPGAGGG